MFNKMQENEPEVLCIGIVRGTPRTYGDTARDDVWRSTIVKGDWKGVESLAADRIPLHLDFCFRVNPQSPSYWGRRWTSGPDLDTMVIGALGGLLRCRNSARPTLRLIEEGGLCRVVTARKTIVSSDENTGFTLHVRAGDTIGFVELADSEISVCVDRTELKRDRRRAVQLAAEQQNSRGYRAPRDMPIEIRLSFASGVSRNPLSADWLEAVIDGLGASRVCTDRFFDGPSHREFGYDDSCVYQLAVAQVSGLPDHTGLHLSCRNLRQSITRTY
jgi:hypothetical protein